MKIISVRFANLNSLPGPFLIRFDETPLADTGLFAITGPTGAGKSTLLDAISVGLYGRVPRHDRQVGEMVSRHAAYAFSEVEFEVHETNPDTGAVARVRYRSRWEVKRKTRGEDKGGIGQDAMSLVMRPSDVAVVSGKEAVPARVSELSGLDFGQFEQSVLLSQGKFARFLHAPEKERSALLEKMTNVGIYSRLSVAAYEKAKEEELKTKLLQAKLDATRLLSAEERAALEAQLEVLHQQAEWHHLEHYELTGHLFWRVRLDQLDKELAEAEREAERLRQADAALQPEFARLAGHARAAAVDKPLGLAEAAAREVASDDKQLRELAENLPRLAATAETAAAAHTTAVAAHAAAQAEENRLRPLLNQAQQQDAAIAAARHQLQIKTEEHGHQQLKLEKEEADLGRAAQVITTLQSQDATLKEWLIAHSAENDLKNQVLALDREIIDLQNAQKEIATREATRTELRKAQGQLEADLRRQRGLETDAVARQQAIKDEGQPCRTERDALLLGTTAADLAQRADDLSAHRQGLQQLLPKAETAHEQQRASRCPDGPAGPGSPRPGHRRNRRHPPRNPPHRRPEAARKLPARAARPAGPGRPQPPPPPAAARPALPAVRRAGARLRRRFCRRSQRAGAAREPAAARPDGAGRGAAPRHHRPGPPPDRAAPAPAAARRSRRRRRNCPPAGQGPGRHRSPPPRPSPPTRPPCARCWKRPPRSKLPPWPPAAAWPCWTKSWPSCARSTSRPARPPPPPSARFRACRSATIPPPATLTKLASELEYWQEQAGIFQQAIRDILLPHRPRAAAPAAL